MSQPTALKCIKTYLYRHEADLAQQLLHDHDIQSHVQSDDVGGMRPELGFGHGHRLFVREADVQSALDILGKEA